MARATAEYVATLPYGMRLTILYTFCSNFVIFQKLFSFLQHLFHRQKGDPVMRLFIRQPLVLIMLPRKFDLGAFYFSQKHGDVFRNWLAIAASEIMRGFFKIWSEFKFTYPRLFPGFTLGRIQTSFTFIQ